MTPQDNPDASPTAALGEPEPTRALDSSRLTMQERVEQFAWFASVRQHLDRKGGQLGPWLSGLLCGV
jgi:hypothetical protein